MSLDPPHDDVDAAAAALPRRTRAERWAAGTTDRPIGRWTAGLVAVLWAGIGLTVLLGWLGPDAAAFLAAGAFTLAIAVALSYDAAVDWFGPQEDGPLPMRFQLVTVLQLPLHRAEDALRRFGIPAFFIAGAVIGHFIWH